MGKNHPKQQTKSFKVQQEEKIMFPTALVLLLFIEYAISGGVSKHHNHNHIQRRIQESYAEVSAYATLHFNDRCKLALQNCLFRTEWEKVFSSRQLDEEDDEVEEKKTKLKKTREISEAPPIDLTYFYCKPFMIALFCVDDYMRRPSSGHDDWESSVNLKCLSNSTDPNSAVSLFKKSIHREKCKFYYGYFFDAYNRASTSRHSNYGVLFVIHLCLLGFSSRNFVSSSFVIIISTMLSILYFPNR